MYCRLVTVEDRIRAAMPALPTFYVRYRHETHDVVVDFGSRWQLTYTMREVSHDWDVFIARLALEAP